MSVLGYTAEFDLSTKRASQDEETRTYVTNLIHNGDITINVALAFFNHACAFYKRAQTIFEVSDSKINIEFQYAARALASYTNGFDETHKALAILDAFQASRHIINDSLDLILSHIRSELKRSELISRDKKIEDVLNGFAGYFALLKEVEIVVEESRRRRGLFRYEAYLKILNSDKYDKLCCFLEMIQPAIRKLEAFNKVEAREGRRFILNIGVTAAIGLIALLITVIGLMYPDEIKALGRNLKCGVTACLDMPSK